MLHQHPWLHQEHMSCVTRKGPRLHQEYGLRYAKGSLATSGTYGLRYTKGSLATSGIWAVLRKRVPNGLSRCQKVGVIPNFFPK